MPAEQVVPAAVALVQLSAILYACPGYAFHVSLVAFATAVEGMHEAYALHRVSCVLGLHPLHSSFGCQRAGVGKGMW
jgi:hypothetical protein